MVRDSLAERIVSGANFSECHERVGWHEGSGEVSEGDGDEGGDEIRATLLEIAEYERECGRIARRRLEGMVSGRVRTVLGLFFDVTDLRITTKIERRQRYPTRAWQS